MRREKPYTKVGLRRLKCDRCGERHAVFQHFSELDRSWYPLCRPCFKYLTHLIQMFVAPDTYDDEVAERIDCFVDSLYDDLNQE